MKVYNQFVKFNPVILYKEDLLQLEKTLTENTDCESVSIRISIYSVHLHGTRMYYEFESFRDLFEEIDLLRIGDMSIDVSVYSEGSELRKHICLNTGQLKCNYTISTEDKNWYYATMGIIDDFFSKRKQRYYFFTRYIFVIFFAISTLLTVANFMGSILRIPMYYQGIDLLNIVYILLVVNFVIFSLAIFKYKLFQCSIIFLDSKENHKLNLNMVTIILTVISTIATVISIWVTVIALSL